MILNRNEQAMVIVNAIFQVMANPTLALECRDNTVVLGSKLPNGDFQAGSPIVYLPNLDEEGLAELARSLPLAVGVVRGHR